MKISIAMATHNGARYLKEQLDSFACQSRLPEELVVCDDLSSDETKDILKTFRQTAPFEVKLYFNECNLGYTRNFEKALLLCSGDLIFISDQDDVWFDNKIEVIENYFLNNQGIMVILNDRELVDELLNPSGLTNFSNLRALGLDDSWPCAGCCTAIRGVFRGISLPFPAELVDYDVWIHKLARAFGVRKVIPDTLQYYRRHSSNASCAMTSSLKKPNMFTPLKEYGLVDATPGWLKEIEISQYFQTFIASKASVLDELMLSGHMASIIEHEQRKRLALKRRIALLKRSHFKRLYGAVELWAAGDYKFFSGWKSLVKDIVR
jgi:glycosyltransferase involved in cell wall biosynthesis